MTELNELAQRISDVYADAMLDPGPMEIAVTECFTGYIHSFHIRGLLAHFQKHGNPKWFDAARSWTEWSLRMQGSYGDPAAYNMGYGFPTRNGVPRSWFVADTTDQAVAILNMAHLLDPYDPLYLRILDSLLKFDQYIQQWNLGERGFALGYIGDEKLDQESYHCAVARCVSYYSGMYLVFNKEIFRQRGATLVEHLIDHDDFSSNYHGAPSTNRCYGSYALVDAYHVLAENDPGLREKIVTKAKAEIVPWAIENQTEGGFWPHDRFGDQPGAAEVLDKSKMSTYTWGVAYGLEHFRRWLPDDQRLEECAERVFDHMKTSLEPGDVNRWGHHAWASTAIAARLYPNNFFPAGAKQPQA